MIWLRLAILLVSAIASSFVASLLTSAWRRRRLSDPETLRLQSMLPGYDCGLCGQLDCGAYALVLDKEGMDPARCGPGGFRLESRLRSYLGERPEDSRGRALRAVVRCGGRDELSAKAFEFDGSLDCRSAARKYGGPRRCKDGCLGFGTCVAACPVGAIHVSSGVATVDPSACTGCGDCARICPKKVIFLVPREIHWYVACSSTREPSQRLGDCRAACTACGECSARSGRNEFVLDSSLAKENAEATGGRWSEIAARCPNGAIALAGAEKKHSSPFRKNGR
jgi:Na+-translocating ferredoxin:NAD+ oxidoreductase subunit B